MLVGIDASRVQAEGRTGTEAYSFYLIRELLRLGPPHRFRLYFRERGPVGLFAPDPGRWEARVIPFPRLWTHVRLSWEMAQRPPDALFVPAHVLPLVHPQRSVVTVHDLGYLYFPEAHRPLERWYLHWSTRFNGRAAARVLAVSETTKADLVRHYGVPPEKVRVVYPGLREGMGPVEDEERVRAVLARYGVRRPYFLSVGTLKPRKNLLRLVRAYARFVAEEGDGARPLLVLAGKPGWQHELLVQEVERLGLTREILFLGYVEDADLPALYTGALAFVFPSLYEGFGLPLVEAMACGTPVVTSRTSACGEVAGDAALLVDPLTVGEIAWALARVARDADLRAALAARGRERARAFSWERAAREVLDVLTSLADLPA
ncbi:MAG: glycosyltransferase family 4 protein [Anaerolineae bacterium]